MPRVWHYDGHSAQRHEAELIPGAGGFALSTDPSKGFAWIELVHGGERGGAPVYKHAARKGWRIGFIDPPPPDIAARLPKPKRYGGIIDKIGFWPTAAAFTAVSAVVLLGVLKAPQLIAPLIPASFEKRLGDAMVGDMGGRICNGPGGQAALDKLVKRIEPDAQALNIRVINVKMVNAVALPGGNIFIFRGLLKEAKSPDEVAGVIGHEIGHVRNRDVMQALLRQTGMSLVLGGVGGNAGGYVNALISATYSRDAERGADGYAIQALKRGIVSPLGTAAFFQRLAADEAKLGRGAAALSYLSSHPLSRSRENAFRASQVAGARYSPAIDAAEWQTLVDICDNDPNVAKDPGLFF